MNDHLSPLARDLALSRSILAATKAKADLPLSDTDRQWVRRLEEDLSAAIGMSQESWRLPPDLVTDADARELFEHGALPASADRVLQLDNVLAHGAVSLLKQLAEHGTLPNDQALKLLHNLQQVRESSHRDTPLLEAVT
jgi:hypothetical protein